MFRKIKKLYFKIYHLFKLLGVFILIIGFKNNVYAECENLITENAYFTNAPRITSYSINRTLLSEEIIEGDTYTIYIDDGTKTFREFLQENGLISSLWTPKVRVFTQSDTNADSCDLDSTYCSETGIMSGIYQFQLIANGTPDNTVSVLNSQKSLLKFVHGDESCLPSDEPETPTTDATYSSFLTLYINKINYLANGFTTNPYLIAMIGIIFAWVVLELLLKILHLRGGYKK